MRFIFYDFETTGRNYNWDQIFQVGAILTNENLEQTEVSEATSASVNYESKNENEISENNGLENFELSDDDTPELFNSDANEEVINTSQEINSEEEEDLEIPALSARFTNYMKWVVKT